MKVREMESSKNIFHYLDWESALKEQERGALWALAVDEGFLTLPECPSLQHNFVMFKKIQCKDTSRHISSLYGSWSFLRMQLVCFIRNRWVKTKAKSFHLDSCSYSVIHRLGLTHWTWEMEQSKSTWFFLWPPPHESQTV